MKRHAFTLTELAAAIVLASLLLIYTHSMIGCGESEQLKSARTKARQMQNTTHVVGIHKGLILYAQGNRDWFPGLDANGKERTESVAAKDKEYGFGTAKGSLPAYRFAVLLRGNYFSPEYMISPAETNGKIKPPTPGANFGDGEAYSFAMLNITDPEAPRTVEWRATQNSRAVVVGDRNIGSEATGKGARSIHTAEGEGWRGSVVYNDNHGNFETSDVLRTEYDLKGEVAADQLFSDAEKTSNGTAGADAAMVFTASNAYVNQQP